MENIGIVAIPKEYVEQIEKQKAKSCNTVKKSVIGLFAPYKKEKMHTPLTQHQNY